MLVFSVLSFFGVFWDDKRFLWLRPDGDKHICGLCFRHTGRLSSLAFASENIQAGNNDFHSKCWYVIFKCQRTVKWHQFMVFFIILAYSPGSCYCKTSFSFLSIWLVCPTAEHPVDFSNVLCFGVSQSTPLRTAVINDDVMLFWEKRGRGPSVGLSLQNKSLKKVQAQMFFTEINWNQWLPGSRELIWKLIYDLYCGHT